MVNNDFFKSEGYAYLGTLLGCNTKSSYLIGFSYDKIDVYSYASNSKLLSSSDGWEFPDSNMRYFFDYSKELNALPFVDIAYNDGGGSYYVPEFKTCRIKNKKAIVETPQVSVDLPEYTNDVGDTHHFRVSPTMLLLSHRRGELISFEYSPNPYAFKSTITKVPTKAVSHVFKTNNDDVVCCFGFNGCNNCGTPNEESDTHIFTLNTYLFFFFNTKEKKVCQHLRFNHNNDFPVEFGITNAYVNEIIQDPEDNYSFKIISHGKVYRVGLNDLVERNGSRKKVEFATYANKAFFDYCASDIPKLDGQEILSTSNHPARVIDNNGLQYMMDMAGKCFPYTNLKINDNEFVLVDLTPNFYYFNFGTNEFVKCHIKGEKPRKFYEIEEVYRNKNEVNFIAYVSMKEEREILSYMLKIKTKDVVNGCEIIYKGR